MGQLIVKRVNRILSMLFDEMRTLSDDERDLPIRWSVMHMYSSAQLAKLLALRRGMDVELASIAAAIHDIATVVTKKSEGHAERAEKYVREAIDRYNNNQWRGNIPVITEEEEDMIVNAIVQHSDKETYSGDSFVELLKDIDSVDRYLHGIKSEGAYLERCTRVLQELGVQV
ncbi:MAG: HD domain-containing protein [Bacillota bacterium]|nr:HD domain-containing protein [Bacillota bacterium]